MNIIIGLILGVMAGSLMSSFCMYLIYVIPFINGLDKKGLLKANHGLKKYVLLGASITLLIGLLIILLAYFFSNQIIFKWLILAVMFLLGTLLLDTHLMPLFFKNRKKPQTILNFKDIIIRQSSSPEVGQILRGLEVGDKYNESSTTSKEEKDEDFHGKNSKENIKTTKTQIAIFFLVLIGFFTATTLGFMIYAFPKFLISKYLLKNKNAKSNIIKDTTIVGLILGILVLFGQMQDLNLPQLQSLENIKEIQITKEPQDEVVIGNLYRNKKYNFRIKFPIEWKIETGDGIHVIKKSYNENGSSITISVVDYEDLEGKNITSIKNLYSLKDFEKQIEEDSKKFFSRYLISSAIETTVASNEAYLIDSIVTSSDLGKETSIRTKLYQFINGDRIYTITLSGGTGFFEDEKELDKSLSSFLIEPDYR